MTQKSVCFLGLGYVGLPTAVVIANSGVEVTGYDLNENHVEAINNLSIQLTEPGLPEALEQAVTSGNFVATTSMGHHDVYILAVPTPFTVDRRCDMSYIDAALDSILPFLKGDELIILESTSPPLTTQRMAERLMEHRPDLVADGIENPDNKAVVYFAHCPERVLPGNALIELVENDRIIGGLSSEATRRASEVYRAFCRGELIGTDARTAELTKLTENAFRDVNIAFANELSLISDGLAIDVWELISLANRHPRVNILQPGPGVGGHCIAVDPWFIISSDPDNSNLIRTAREVNDRKPNWVIKKVGEAFAKSGAKRIAIFGLAFKADIDDLRESPAIEITREIATRLPHAQILAVEPNISQLPASLQVFENIELVDMKTALSNSDVITLLVDHRQFKEVTADALAGKEVVDTKGIWV